MGLIAKYDRRSLDRGEGAGCFKSMNRLADEIGMDRRQFRRSVDRTVEFGYVLRTPRGERWDGYVLRIIYRGEDSVALTLGTVESSPPHDSTVPTPGDSVALTVRAQQSGGWGLSSPHIREDLREQRKEDAAAAPHDDHDEVIKAIADHWNVVAVPRGFGAIRGIRNKRRASVLALVQEHGVEEIKRAIEKFAASEFLHSKRNAFARFEWLMKPDNLVKTLEGNYDQSHSREGRSLAQIILDERDDRRDGFTRAIDRRLNNEN
jgi:hypothetical protein